MEVFHISGTSRHTCLPFIYLFPIGHHDVTLLLEKFRDLSKIPIGIMDIGFHVIPPSKWQTLEKKPFFIFLAYEVSLETPIGLPILHEILP